MNRTDRFAHDAGLIRNPLRWPAYPFLPLVRRRGDGNMPDLGLLIAPEESVIWDLNLYSLPRSGKLSDLRASSTVLARYETVEAMLEDGWEVD